MTENEKQVEIAAMVTERNELRRKINCLENKQDRISKALAEIKTALASSQKISAIQGGGIVASADGAELPPVAEILDTHNQIVDAKARVEVLTERINNV